MADELSFLVENLRDELIVVSAAAASYERGQRRKRPDIATAELAP
jgi:hypothetical protein